MAFIPLTAEERDAYVDGFSLMLGHPDSRVRSSGQGLLAALLRMARFTEDPNVAFPAFGQRAPGGAADVEAAVHASLRELRPAEPAG